jgi:D-serine deaminase-like pyridoxal phosphate-dependent protein
LARKVHDTKGLRLEGVMGYEGHTLYIQEPDVKRHAIHEAIARLIDARDALLHAGLPCPIVSAGGSGSYQITSEIPGVTELQAGGGIFACQYYTKLCKVDGHQPALTVLATVVSRPSDERLILDIGQKSISEFRTPAILPDLPGSRIVSLSAEHAIVDHPPSDSPRIGEKLAVIPGYSDFTFVLHDRVLGIRGDRVESVWELYGRGMLQ